MESAREQAPVLLDRLRAVKPDKADWIEDVYSEVLKQLRQDNVKDRTMVDWLMESIHYHLNNENSRR
jgi:hypothetical protein